MGEGEIGMGRDEDVGLAGAEKYIARGGHEGVPFPVSEYVTRQVNGLADLEALFESPGSEMPVHFVGGPDAKYSPAQAEFVPLSRVVGGADAARYDGTFLVYPRGKEPEGRGRDRVLEICRSYADGRGLDPHSPQEYYEVNGDYYVTSGRYSTAALKALGVPHIPALVTRVKK